AQHRVGFNGAAPARARNSGSRSLLRRRAAPLQWGRARAGAEFTIGIAAKIGPAGFNGAAPARARNYREQLRKSLSSRRLQWGRARAGAEFFLVFVDRAALLRLQWGRARAGAEFF